MIGRVELDALTPFGTGLHRPECVLTTLRGVIYTSDSRGGVMQIDGGGVQRYLKIGAITPNGVALLKDGSFLAANLEGGGGVWRLSGEGAEGELFLSEIEGRALASVNFILADGEGRIWITVSSPRAAGGVYDRHAAEGFIAVVEGGRARVVADGLRWTNECRIDAEGKELYVVETFGRKITAFKIKGRGDLGASRTVTEFGAGVFPDGMALDQDGGVWVTSIISNRLIRVDRSGAQEVILEDPDPALEDFERAFESNSLTRGDVNGARGRRLRNISSVSFGGPDLKTVYLGCLNGDRLEQFRSPVAGQPLAHWLW